MNKAYKLHMYTVTEDAIQYGFIEMRKRGKGTWRQPNYCRPANLEEHKSVQFGPKKCTVDQISVQCLFRAISRLFITMIL